MRDSDRWVTPRVVVVGLCCATLVLLALIGALVWLTERGLDPSPVLKLTAQVGGGLAGVLSLVLQLVNRRTVAKTERNTGVLANAVYDVADAIPRPGGPRHAYADTVYMQAAPAPPGS